VTTRKGFLSLNILGNSLVFNSISPTLIKKRIKTSGSTTCTGGEAVEKKGVSSAIIIVIVIVIAAVGVGGYFLLKGDGEEGSAESGLTPHDPILIVGNDNFTLANGVVDGRGTESDPYIIENWVISAENVHGIKIRNTTAYFVIHSCVVENGWGGVTTMGFTWTTW